MPSIRRIWSWKVAPPLPVGYYICPTTEWDNEAMAEVASALNLPSKGTWIGPLKCDPIPGWEHLDFDADPNAVISVVNALANQMAKKVATAQAITEEVIRVAYNLYLQRDQMQGTPRQPIRLRDLAV